MEEDDSVGMIRGECKKCGRMNWLEKVSIPPLNYQILICGECSDKYYSKSAIRDQKINKLLKPWWKFW